MTDEMQRGGFSLLGGPRPAAGGPLTRGRRGPRALARRARAALPHSGGLPQAEWDRRHRLVTWILVVAAAGVLGAEVIVRGGGLTMYLPEDGSLLLLTLLALRGPMPRRLRAVAASLGLLTASALLVDLSGGLAEMHFVFFITAVLLTLYEDWTPFLLAIAFVFLHHGAVGSIAPDAVFEDRDHGQNPWAWATLHAFFMALAGAAAMTAWRLNEQVRERMRRTSSELRRAHIELQAAHDELAAIATSDPLTGLPNHRTVVAAIEREIERSLRYRHVFSLLFIDLDHFKELNDSYGHRAGDRALKTVGRLVSERLRVTDTLGRWGGEEFVAILPETGEHEARRVAESIRRVVAGHAFGGSGMHLTCSIGIAIHPDDGARRSALVDAADRAMYAAKRLGRNQACAASDPGTSALELAAAGSRKGRALAGTLEALARLVDARDASTGAHAQWVSELTVKLAAEMGCDENEARMLGVAARLHDVGKVAVPDAILRKAGPLASPEWSVMRRHPIVGAEVIGMIPSLRGLAPVIRAHHERIDGAGYPDGLSGEGIPLGARIVAVADAFSAMTSDRPYRAAMSREDALTELRTFAGTQFDSGVVEALDCVLDRRGGKSVP